MSEAKKNTVSDQDMSDLLTSTSLKKKQSVRATFRLPDEIINLLSVVASQLGLKQKSLLDQLVEDKDLLDRLVEKQIDAKDVERKDVRPKTFVVSRNSLHTLDNMAREKNMPRDLLVEISIRRLVPVLNSEHEKQTKRKQIHEDSEAFFLQGGKLLQKASRLLGKEDDYYILLKHMIEMCKETERELRSIVDKGNAMDDFDFPK
ncbi:MAG: hypothetical protein KJ630_20800 [Proteobacteria bacterium]|nr:hypothetical protein [Pseudomonadota bacterium]